MNATERPLHEVLDLDVETVDVDVAASYPLTGVYSFGRGLFKRNELRGSDTSYKKLHRLRQGQLVVSKLKAFEGAIAVVPPEFDGFHLSPEFPTFSCRDGELDEEYLSHLCAWPDFWQRLASTSKGIGARRERVSPTRLLEIYLPIPDLDRQREIGQTLTLRMKQVKTLDALSQRATALSDAAAIALACRPDLSVEEKCSEGWERTRLGLLMEEVADRVSVDPTATYPNLGLYSFGRGVFKKEPIDGSRTSATTLNRVHSGQFIYSRLFAFEGAYAHVPPEFEGFFVSGEFPTFQTDPDELDARWLATYLRSPSIWTELGATSKGLGQRRQRVHVQSVLDFEIWKPPLPVQHQVCETVGLLSRHRELRTEVEPVSSALWLSVLNELVLAAA